jgi:two-component system, LytTR family, sensor kinase
MKLRNRKLQYIYAGLWMIISVIHSLVLVIIYRIEPAIAITESLLFNILFALIGVGLWYMVRYAGLERRSWQELVFLHMSGITVVIVLWLLPGLQLLQALFSGEPEYLEFLERTITVRVITGSGFYIGVVSISYLVMNIQQMRIQATREAALENQLKEAELSMLRFQINPHFLFNSLNTISSLIVTRPTEANAMIIKLSDFMRYSLDSSGKHMSTLGKEITHCNLYLGIERIRFGDRLKIQIETTDAPDQFPVPAMLLQPLIENAVKHGLEDADDGISIEIKAVVKGGRLELTMSNPVGDGSRIRPAGTGTGLKNIRARLDSLYGHDATLVVSRDGGRFLVMLNIPEYA